MKSQISITMKPLVFYSRMDERSLTQNLETIPSIKKIDQIDSGLIIMVDAEEMNWDAFKDILSLFIRYNLDLRPLGCLVPDDEVREWFLAPERDWHHRLQGNPGGMNTQ